MISLRDAVSAFVLVVMGLSGGMIAGTAFVALLTALQIPSRVVALTYTRQSSRVYEWALILGAWAAAFWLPLPYIIPLGRGIAAFIGLTTGIFVGMLASALAETIGVVPVMAKRTGLGGLIGKVVWAVAAGKIIGSLTYWTFPPFNP